MDFSNDKPPLCAFCQKVPATETYTHKSVNLLACAPCLERRNVRDALDDQLPQVFDLERRCQYDEALACLDIILEANRHRDHDGWLARTIAHHRAAILFEAGRYAEAEEAYRAWAQLGFVEGWERWMHALETAHTFERKGSEPAPKWFEWAR